MRQIIFDTETTGMNFDSKDPSQGHRIIEIGCVELINRRPTGNYYHCYIRPDRKVEAGAIKVHGITDEFLANQPVFNDILPEFLAYLEGADELIAHNMPFDQAFFNREFALAKLGYKIEERYRLVDTLEIARKKFPGQKNNLDILCKRFNIDNSKRELHGALLDSELLAEVYLKLTTEQSGLDFTGVPMPAGKPIASRRPENNHNSSSKNITQDWLPACATAQEQEKHREILATIRHS